MARHSSPALIPQGTPVWLVPRTLGAPAICWRQARGTWARYEAPYVIVLVDGLEYRVHEDNVRLTDPTAAPKPRQRKRTPKEESRYQLHLSDGYTEVPLW